MVYVLPNQSAAGDVLDDEEGLGSLLLVSNGRPAGRHSSQLHPHSPRVVTRLWSPASGASNVLGRAGHHGALGCAQWRLGVLNTGLGHLGDPGVVLAVPRALQSFFAFLAYEHSARIADSFEIRRFVLTLLGRYLRKKYEF